ncbi:2,3-diaminopropionate biosynthesis protein SbnB [Pandoraea sputorum]|uniref:Alanine dehydrogenase n=1 Tax=Pandoraea sputorum TaxID=93222 RepID=A0A239S7X8_9BURK|nr:2,3-diaminopropionate biosynthesis protein SbnB [Pandoraea sputorum]AJC15846.1 2,3-diaminopropionate biosynthesis protein SbnB [Pandoraea sputorum]SNU81536.1 alanine dehydrogenase [Pandoraea sputorum]VVD65981.1 2,3-diaminopropionate biosynthesis protein SbnB [Pandoraea sputorum]
MNARPIPQFRVFTGEQIDTAVRHGKHAILDTVEAAYRAHHAGHTVNPESQFLRFPDAQRNRIIALPAHIRGRGEGRESVTGIKWISSFPENIERGMPRASAVLILNDAVTGYPMACMEASIISAARTAASAISALRCLAHDATACPRRVALIGAGVIARHVAECLPLAELSIGEVMVHDLNIRYAESLASRIETQIGLNARVEASLENAIRESDVIVLATTAVSPHIEDPEWFAHCPIVLHLSLRDLAPSIVMAAHNVVDDIDHCLRASTSLHLTEIATGHRRFVTTSLPHLLSGGEPPMRDRPIVFSPFGLGILDIAVGRWVYECLAAEQAPIPRFFFDLHRA